MHPINDTREIICVEDVFLAGLDETVDALWEDGLECINASTFDDVDESTGIEDDL